MCVCVSSGSWLCLRVLIFGSPVVWVTWRFSPSQLPQMVRAQQLSTRGERGGSVVITSWLSGSAKAVNKTSSATGTRGCECRLYGGPWALRGQVLVCVYKYAVSRYSMCIHICSCVCVWPLMLINVVVHTWYTFILEHLLQKLILVAVLSVLISQKYKWCKFQVIFMSPAKKIIHTFRVS